MVLLFCCPRPPTLIDLQWCPPGVVDAEVLPLVCLVGKGVCFDSGGLDIKSAQGMKLMKKVGVLGGGGSTFFGEVWAGWETKRWVQAGGGR